MRNSPKKLTPAPYEVPAHVVKPWTSAGLAGQAVGARGSILRQRWRRDFDVIQERRLSRFCARLVQSFQHESPARQAGASRQKQEERQDHRDVDRNGAECVSCDRLGLAGRKLRLFVVTLARALAGDTKAASQNIGIAGRAIKHTDGQSTWAMWGGWVFELFG